MELEYGIHRLPISIATLGRYFQYLHSLPTTPCLDLSEISPNFTVIFPYAARLQLKLELLVVWVYPFRQSYPNKNLIVLAPKSGVFR